MKNRKYYTPEKIVQAYQDCRKDIGRNPTLQEFAKKYRGALDAIRHRGVIPNVTTWNDFLRYMGETIGYDKKKYNTPEKIKKVYEQCKKELGRVPTQKEFAKEYRGALASIRRRKIIPGVTSWTGLVRYMGDKPHRQVRDSASLLESLLEDGDKQNGEAEGDKR